jgi:hypothetical protein
MITVFLGAGFAAVALGEANNHVVTVRVTGSSGLAGVIEVNLSLPYRVRSPGSVPGRKAGGIVLWRSSLDAHLRDRN